MFHFKCQQYSSFKFKRAELRIPHNSSASLRGRIKHLIGRINTWLTESTLNWQNQYLILLLDPLLLMPRNNGCMDGWFYQASPNLPNKWGSTFFPESLAPKALHCIASTLIKYTTTHRFPMHILPTRNVLSCKKGPHCIYILIKYTATHDFTCMPYYLIGTYFKFKWFFFFGYTYGGIIREECKW
jgi:hypothetical protein